MKTKEELKQLKDEVEKLGLKLNELNEDELQEVTGGLKRVDTLDITTVKGAND